MARTRRITISISLIIMVMAGLLVLSTVKSNANTKLSNPVNNGSVTTWDCIYFGNYEQNWNADKTEFVRSPIKWRVACVSGNKALIITDKTIISGIFHTSTTTGGRSTWSNSILRSMLNGYNGTYNKKGQDWTGAGFIDKAFTATEREAILDTQLSDVSTSDKIFAPSYDEVKNTAYRISGAPGISDKMADAYKNNKYKDSLPYSWFTRTTSTESGYDDVYMYSKGSGLKLVRVSQDAIGVRPMMWIDTSKSVWKNAGTVNSNGVVDEKGAITPDTHTCAFTEKVISDEYLKSAATCTKAATYYYSCAKCGKKGTKTFASGKALGHQYEVVVKPATCKKDGSTYKQCSVCKAKTKATKILKASNISLKSKSVKYKGDNQEKVAVVIKNSKKKAISAKFYDLSYDNNYETGKGKVKITFKGNYAGSKTLSYTIKGVPKR